MYNLFKLHIGTYFYISLILCDYCLYVPTIYLLRFGVVALTRNFALRGRQGQNNREIVLMSAFFSFLLFLFFYYTGPWKKDGVKAMALCPW